MTWEAVFLVGGSQHEQAHGIVTGGQKVTLVGPGLDQRGALAQLWKPSCELCRGSAGMGEAVQWCRRDQEASQGPAVVQAE